MLRECGKCGAAQHRHEHFGQPMGLACQLTMNQGAIPGAVLAYQRRLYDLAARAELQKQQRQMEAASWAGLREAATPVTGLELVAAVESDSKESPPATESTAVAQ